jgi:plasmid stabilization system protein ParE
MPKAQFSKRALSEVEDAWLWYEGKSAGLGDRFLQEVFFKVNLIEKHPKRFRSTIDSFREALLKKFPYLIVYYADDDDLIINSVFHCKREPVKKYKK